MSLYGSGVYGSGVYGQGAAVPPGSGHGSQWSGTEFRLYARDENRVSLGALTSVVGGEFRARHLGVGTFTVTLPPGEEADLLRTPGYGLIAVGASGVLMTGRILRHVYSVDEAEGPRWTFVGEDDSRLLRVLGWPVPSNTLTTQDSEAWTETGPAETVMKNIVSANFARLGVTAAIAPDEGRGGTVILRSRMASLLDLLKDAGRLGGLGWRIGTAADGTLAFDVYEPQDRENEVLFSFATGTLTALEYERLAPSVTNVVVGGQGEGTLRTFEGYSNAVAIAEWRDPQEVFLDQRQADTAAELDQAGADELAENGDRTRLALTVADAPGQEFGVNYFLGDLLPVQVAPGFVVKEQLLELRASLDENGRTLSPVLGAAEELPTTAALRSLGRGLRNLERSR